MCPVGLIYLHFEISPRQHLQSDLAERMRQAKHEESENQWPSAVSTYDAMLASIVDFSSMMQKKNIPSDAHNPATATPTTGLTEKQRIEITIKLARAKALTNVAQISESINLLENLLAELNRKKINDALTDEVRNNLAIIEYYIAWHMRIEGYNRSTWIAETETSRQLFKLLATQAELDGNTEHATELKKNLHAVIRLEQMDLPTLRALPLPELGAGKGEKFVGRKREEQKKKGTGSGEGEGEGKKGDQKSKPKGNKPSDSRKAGSRNFTPQPGS